mgnify:CR=1 FL=1|jgi:predicted ribonuclease YlaK|nr:MAG TPA: NYN ribonuclease and ATPase [Caudoviricetes sp.]
MATKKKTVENCFGDPPKALDGHPFYGLDCTDAEQIEYRDALWNRDIRFVAVDACAGSGKTTFAIAVALMYVKYGICDEALYVRTPSSEGRIGFLPGERESKERPYMQPLYNTLAKLGENPMTTINDSTMLNQKNGTGIFTPMTDVYMLGEDLEKKFVIIDEAQCMTKDQLRAIITRCHDDCKVVVIGSTLQIQGIKKENSGLERCIEHFSGKEWAKICHLTKNYRGEMSAWADEL